MDEQVKLNTQNIMDLSSDMGATAHELQKLNTFWVEKYNQLHDKITTLEKQLKTLTTQVDLNSQTLEALQ